MNPNPGDKVILPNRYGYLNSLELIGSGSEGSLYVLRTDPGLSFVRTGYDRDLGVIDTLDLEGGPMFVRLCLIDDDNPKITGQYVIQIAQIGNFYLVLLSPQLN